MKTTVEISDPLMADAKALAAEEGTTFRALLEAGLRQVLSERRARKRFKLKDGRVSGRGLSADLRDADWERIRAGAYEGRGG